MVREDKSLPARTAPAGQPSGVGRGFGPGPESELPPLPVRARWVLHLMVLFLLSALAWACLAQVDRVVTAQGRIGSPERNMVVQPLETSVIKEIHVTQGQRVEEGQALVTLDPTFAEAGVGEIARRRASLEAQAWRLACEAEGEKPPPKGLSPAEFKAQQALLAERRAEFRSRAAALDRASGELEAKLRTNQAAAEQARKQIRLAQDMENMFKDVYERGASSRLEYMKAQSARIEAESHLVRLGNEAAELRQAQARAREERESFASGWRVQAGKELQETLRELAQLEERARKAGRLQELVVLRAPKAGVVLELAKKSVGSVVDEGEPVATLVPLDAGLEAEADVRVADIGFLREGDPARVKLEAFPYQRHGVLEGRVRVISPDALEKNTPDGPQFVYRIRVALENPRLRAVPADFRLIPGMGLTAEVLVGKRRVITYLTYPLLRSLDEAMREP
ncbi:Hemolysin secretion protein D, chromosomal [Fundidesulfovibrio magnetotacticus]|uniref:Hemolysin secretion protein D, chromosomal n=1 Tax=Fundidesulfovibrio magnetotacticus TaxID=2730080 RepID=A0A6V8LT43_9BACT|nr:HlyD family type I secretion periplasmic adaptor subunit [Fundidesulfovibrio magnetotacticus]GFK93488.1 Hemolysin secretion protein D, chromosomal [Fundidesulfovibrio magnetotacticus]